MLLSDWLQGAPAPRSITMSGATANPEVQHLVFLGLGALPGVVSQPHP